VDHLDTAELERFERECGVLARLSAHPNIVTIYDFGVLADGQPYLLIELSESGSLASLLNIGPLSPSHVINIGHQTAQALREAHRAGVVHGGVKPANITLRSSGEPALTDFALSIRESPDREGDLFRLLHVAPETFTDGVRTPASDVYALGSTLYLLLTGEPPFPRLAGEGPLPHMWRVLSQPVPALARGSGIPEDLSDLLSAMLSVRPQDRPSAQMVATRLASCRAAAGFRAAEPTAEARLPKLSFRSRVNPRRAAAMAGVGAALAAMAGALALGLGLGAGSSAVPPAPPATIQPAATAPQPPDSRR
jgi:serine/threonine protein kinase